MRRFFGFFSFLTSSLLTLAFLVMISATTPARAETPWVTIDSPVAGKAYLPTEDYNRVYHLAIRGQAHPKVDVVEVWYKEYRSAADTEGTWTALGPERVVGGRWYMSMPDGTKAAIPLRYGYGDIQAVRVFGRDVDGNRIPGAVADAEFKLRKVEVESPIVATMTSWSTWGSIFWYGLLAFLAWAIFVGRPRCPEMADELQVVAGVPIDPIGISWAGVTWHWLLGDFLNLGNLQGLEFYAPTGQIHGSAFLPANAAGTLAPEVHGRPFTIRSGHCFWIERHGRLSVVHPKVPYEPAAGKVGEALSHSHGDTGGFTVQTYQFRGRPMVAPDGSPWSVGPPAGTSYSATNGTLSGLPEVAGRWVCQTRASRNIGPPAAGGVARIQWSPWEEWTLVIEGSLPGFYGLGQPKAWVRRQVGVEFAIPILCDDHSRIAAIDCPDPRLTGHYHLNFGVLPAAHPTHPGEWALYGIPAVATASPEEFAISVTWTMPDGTTQVTQTHSFTLETFAVGGGAPGRGAKAAPAAKAGGKAAPAAKGGGGPAPAPGKAGP